MRVTVVTLGSRGDVQPFIALAYGLQQAGHTVKVATGTNFQQFVRQFGLDYAPIRGDMKAMLSSDEGRKLFKSSNPIAFVRRLKKTATQMLATMQDDILSGVGDAELVVFSYLSGPVIDIAEKTGLPCFMGVLQPVLRTGEFPQCGVTLKNLHPFLNRITYDAFQLMMWAAFGRMANKWRKERFGLPKVPIWRRIEKLHIPVLAAFSSHIIPKPKDWPDHSYVTGYWFLDHEASWQPPIDLVQFLASGNPPICVGFGSMVDDKATHVLDSIKEALIHTNQRAVIVGGWNSGEFRVENNTQFHWVESVPYDWLLPQVSVLLHHGGAGTTSTVLRAGIPSIVIPFFADQPFWAARVHQLGLSPAPIPRKSLNSRRLIHALELVIRDRSMRERAAEMGQKIRSEDGIKTAIKIIEGSALCKTKQESIAL